MRGVWSEFWANVESATSRLTLNTRTLCPFVGDLDLNIVGSITSTSGGSSQSSLGITAPKFYYWSLFSRGVASTILENLRGLTSSLSETSIGKS